MINFTNISLIVKCPLCGKSLMNQEVRIDDAPGIKLMVNQTGNNGIIHLSSVYGSYHIDAKIPLTEGEVALFSCPHCQGLLNTDELCTACNAPMVAVLLDMGGKINFCSRKGCKKHSVEFEDLSQAMKKLYESYDQYSG
jgi:hypothetical protein